MKAIGRAELVMLRRSLTNDYHENLKVSPSPFSKEEIRLMRAAYETGFREACHTLEDKQCLLVEGESTVKTGDKVTPEETVGRTVSGVTYGAVEGPTGDEPVVYLHFTDGSQTGFVLPLDDE